jgi:hypothetical protein
MLKITIKSSKHGGGDCSTSLSFIAASRVPDPCLFETDPGPSFRTLDYGSGSVSVFCSFRQWLSRCQHNKVILLSLLDTCTTVFKVQT